MANLWNVWKVGVDHNGYIDPDSYVKCWSTALTRAAFLLNRNHEAFAGLRLSVGNDVLLSDVTPLVDGELFTLEYSEVVRKRLDEQAIATDFFYGSLSLEPNQTQNILRFGLRKAFLDYSYEGFCPPMRFGGQEYFDERKYVEEDHFLEDCAVNYILRNIWHNYAHRRLQNINDGNYWLFAGGARHESDFHADLISSIMLVSSYGIPALCSLPKSEVANDRIIELFRMNKCNQLFVLRAQQRPGSGSTDGTHWRFRRSLANYISGYLISKNLTPTSLSLHLTDEQKIACQINGRYFFSKNKAPLTGGSKVRYEYAREVASSISNEFRGNLNDDANFYNWSSSSLRELKKVLLIK